MDWKNKSNTWVEEIEIAVGGLTDRVKELVREGNVRRLIIRKENGELIMEVPLTAGVAAGAVLTYMLPLLIGVVAITGLLTRVKIEVVRSEDNE